MDQTQWQRDFEKARDREADADIRADVKAATCAENTRIARHRATVRTRIVYYRELLENDADAAPTLKAMICDRLGDLYKELSRDIGGVQ